MGFKGKQVRQSGGRNHATPMAGRTRRVKPRYLGITFIVAVMIPSVLLAALAIRAAGREEAYVERQRETALEAEVMHEVALVDAEVGKALEELLAGCDVPAGARVPDVLTHWKSVTPLVEVPFLVSARFQVLWPPASGALSDVERQFLQENGEFLGNIQATDVYRNIATLYKDEILAEVGKTAGSGAGAASTPGAQIIAQAPAPAAPSEGEPAVAQSLEGSPEAKEEQDTRAERAAAPPAQETSPSLQQEAPVQGASSGRDRGADNLLSMAVSSAASPTDTEYLANQAAITAFNESPPIKAKVYEEAQKKGDQIATRNVSPAVEEGQAPKAPAAQQSLLVITPGTLGEISLGKDYGLIPRFIGERLTFLFWERQADGRLAGCGVNAEVLRARIAATVADPSNEDRILTVLDERGAPLVVPPGAAGRDWLRPFISREIGASLPRWEAASYLTNPAAISARARMTSLVIWILVAILFVSVAGGGSLVLSGLYGELRMARNKATFVTNVSHELKTPLTSINLFVELLRKPKGVKSGKAGQYLERISSETERLTRLINNVLDFSAMERGTKRYSRGPVDVTALCLDLVEGQRVRLESAGFSLRLGLQSGRILLDADGEAIKQAVLNLLANAEKYSGRAKEIEVEVVREGPDAVIHVRDRGMGVPEAVRERIFEEFFRLDDSLTARVKGTGLGLTIARRIVRDHGGDIACLGRAGGGSDFALRLPAAGRGAEGAARKGPRTPGSAKEAG